MISIKIIDNTCKDDINIKNEPFRLFGRMIPSYVDGKWNYEVERLPEKEITEMCFPDENYDYDELAKNSVLAQVYVSVRFESEFRLQRKAYWRNADGKIKRDIQLVVNKIESEKVL